MKLLILIILKNNKNSNSNNLLFTLTLTFNNGNAMFKTHLKQLPATENKLCPKKYKSLGVQSWGERGEMDRSVHSLVALGSRHPQSVAQLQGGF